MKTKIVRPGLRLDDSDAACRKSYELQRDQRRAGTLVTPRPPIPSISLHLSRALSAATTAATSESPFQPTNVHSGTTVHDADTEDEMTHVTPAPAPMHKHSAMTKPGTSRRTSRLPNDAPPSPTSTTTVDQHSHPPSESVALQQHSKAHCKHMIRPCRGSRCYMQASAGNAGSDGWAPSKLPAAVRFFRQDSYHNFHGRNDGVTIA